MMYLKNILAGLALLLFCSSVYGQEDCFNGIDDDGDGLIDLQDQHDCNCNVSNVLLSKSFEEKSCCPTGRNYSTLVDCLDEGWLTPTGSIDYFNTCGWMGDEQSPFVPLPMPSGEGVIGLGVSADFPFYESAVNCLDSPMTSGESHEISFYVGFGIDQGFSISTLTTTIAIYGKTDCEALYIGDDDCLSNYNDWELITEIPVSSPFVDNWVFVSHSFIPILDYAAIGIAMTCGSYSVSQYHFLDDVKILGPEASNAGDLVSFGDCTQGVTVELQNTSGTDFQWYLDGVAILGATSNPHIVTNASADGEYQVMVIENGVCKLSNPLYIEIEENVLNIDGDIIDVACAGGNNGSISLDLFSLNLPFTIDWDNGGSDTDIFDLEAGTYSVTVTDANGCFGSNTFTIQDPENPVSGQITSLIQPSDISIFGQATIEPLGGIAPYSVVWSNGENSTTADSLPVGINSVFITDANGCVDTIEVAIFYPLTYRLQVSDDPCNQCEGQINIQIEGGIPGYSIQWGNGSDTTALSGLCAARYSFTVIDSLGNQIVDTIEITGTSPLALMVSELKDTICKGSMDGMIGLNTTGGASVYTYAWSNGDTTSKITNLREGAYEVVVTDTNGCTVERVFEVVELDTISVLSDIVQPNCTTGTDGTITLIVSGGQEPYATLWSDGSTNLSLVNYPAGTYAVTITDHLGCIVTDSIVLTNTGNIQASITVAQPTCFDSPAGSILLGNIDFDSLSIFINGHQVHEEIITVDTGTYEVEIIDVMGCSLQESVTISVPAPIEANTIFVSSLNVNGLASATIDIVGGIAPYVVSWSNGEMGLQPTMLHVGENIANITDANGCVTQLLIMIDKPSLILDHTIVHNLCYDQCEGTVEIIPLVSLGELTYSWDNGHLGPVAADLCNGDYTVTVTDLFGNEQTIPIEINSPSPLDITDYTTHESCLGENDGSIELDITGGTAPFIIFHNDQPFIGNGLAPDMYRLIITDANGCEIAYDAEVLEFTVPPIDLFVQNPACRQYGEIGILNFGAYDFDIILSSDSLETMTFLDNTIGELTPGAYQIILDVHTNCQVPLQGVILSEPAQINADTIIEKLQAESGTVILEIDDTLLNQASSIDWISNTSYDCIHLDMDNQCTSIQVDIVESDVITVVITDALGCNQVVLYDITLSDNYDIFAPNIISSQSGQRFKLVTNNDLIFLEEISIFSRWGEKVYTEQDIPIKSMVGWDITFRSRSVVSGVYVYTANYRLPDGRIQNMAGDITVVK